MKERERTGIPKLKVGYNRVFGYFIRDLQLHKNQAPPEYIRKQTLTNCERFITPELKELEGRILGAHEKSIQLETQLFDQVRTIVAEQAFPSAGDCGRHCSVGCVGFLRQNFHSVSLHPPAHRSGRKNCLEGQSASGGGSAAERHAFFVPNDVLLDQRKTVWQSSQGRIWQENPPICARRP